MIFTIIKATIPVFLLKMAKSSHNNTNKKKTIVISLTQKDYHLNRDYVPKTTHTFINYYSFSIFAVIIFLIFIKKGMSIQIILI